MDPPALPLSEASTLKRKRSPNWEEGRDRPIAHSGHVTQIDYVMKAKPERLRLIEGDSETFGDVLGMIDDYEGVLQRHESLAANLGAKLVGPLLLKSFEKLFDGPIRTLQSSFTLDQAPITWLDIVTFARTNPSEFYLSESPSSMRTCRFWIKGGQVEISEDDYRLIMSGAPERMIPTQPIADDESAELATLNILEGRLAMLIKKADAVASKARQLNYHLKGRKNAVMSRKVSEPSGVENERTQPFSAINARSPAPQNGEAAKLQQQLLEQFLSLEPRQSVASVAPSQSRPKISRVSTADHTNSRVNTFNGESSHSASDNRRLSSHPPTSDDRLESNYKVLMASKIEKLAKGDGITPPCDRCRRLKFECTKHLTACQACTKKHAKCSWKDIREGELDFAATTVNVQNAGGAGNEGESGFMVNGGGGEHGPAEPSMIAGNAAERRRELGWKSIEMNAKDKERQENMANEATMLSQIASAAVTISP